MRGATALTCRTCDKSIVFDQENRRWFHARTGEVHCHIDDYTPPVAAPKEKGWIA